MAYEDLIKSIETAAEEKKQEVIRNAEREVEAILRQAETESSAIHEQYVQKAKRDLILESNRQKFLAKQDVKKQISAVRQKLLDDAFLKAEKMLAHIRTEPVYPSLFERLTREVISALAGEDIVLHIDPIDTDVCKDVMQKIGVHGTVVHDITTIGGLVGISADGKIRADNTLERRLERTKEMATLEIMSKILGGFDG